MSREKKKGLILHSVWVHKNSKKSDNTRTCTIDDKAGRTVFAFALMTTTTLHLQPQHTSTNVDLELEMEALISVVLSQC